MTPPRLTSGPRSARAAPERTSSNVCACQAGAAFAEAVAVRVVDLLAAMPKQTGGDAMKARSHDATEVPAPAPALLTAHDVAARLGASADYVRDHAAVLGAVRLPGALLRFDAGVIDELTSASGRCCSERPHAAEPPAAPDVSASRRRRRSGAAADLLPIRGAKHAAE